MLSINIKTTGRSILSIVKQAEENISKRYDQVKNRMDKAYKRYVPHMAIPELIAVSKTFTAEEILPMLDLGHRVYGENRVQEAAGKWPDLKQKYEGVALHLIGPLQTNKVGEAVKLFDVIQTLDREKLARALAREMEKTGKNIPCYVQVNIGNEPQKSGIIPQNSIEFVQKCRNDFGLDIVGLMCIPPAGISPGPYFAQLAQLAKQANVKFLSMGMSSDFETAIEMGATHIRVGTALFGKR